MSLLERLARLRQWTPDDLLMLALWTIAVVWLLCSIAPEARVVLRGQFTAMRRRAARGADGRLPSTPAVDAGAARGRDRAGLARSAAVPSDAAGESLEGAAHLVARDAGLSRGAASAGDVDPWLIDWDRS